MRGAWCVNVNLKPWNKFRFYIICFMFYCKTSALVLKYLGKSYEVYDRLVICNWCLIDLSLYGVFCSIWGVKYGNAKSCKKGQIFRWWVGVSLTWPLHGPYIRLRLRVGGEKRGWRGVYEGKKCRLSGLKRVFFEGFGGGCEGENVVLFSLLSFWV